MDPGDASQERGSKPVVASEAMDEATGNDLAGASSVAVAGAQRNPEVAQAAAEGES
jgi:hypothetical protein